MTGPPEPTGPRRAVLVPHTHWDREWYLPFDGFLPRLIEMMDRLIDVLDRERGFAHFHLDGQVAMIDDYLEARPEREADVRRLARSGRISVGPWYTQMDEFLVSGESLVRNLERGMARARDLRGTDRPLDGPAFGYLPDQFGHIGQMPQILRMAGIRDAVVWRGVPSTISRTAFRWRAPDGSEVLTEYLAFGYGVGWEFSQQHDADGVAGALRRAFDLVAPYAARPDRVLVTVGADHAIPQADLAPLLPEASRRAGVDAAFGSISSFLDGSEPPDLQAWHGELRSAARAHLLPNVYGARAHQKRERARVEALVERYAEPLAALVPGAVWPRAAFDRIWRLLLWNGAHDSVCGCSVDAVAHDVDARYAEARAGAQAIVDGALDRLAAMVAARPGSVLAFNPSPFDRDGVPGLGWTVDPVAPPAPVPIRVDGSDAVVDVDGTPLGLRLVDERDVGDLYTFCPDGDGAPVTGGFAAGGEGEAVASFPGLTVRLRATRAPGDPFVRLDGTIRNERPDHRLRLHVRLPGRAERAVALSPFEVVERPLVSEGSALEAPSPTWPARGAVLAGATALLSEGVIEYEVTDAPTLAVTLLRCVGSISHGGLRTRPAHAGPDIATPDAQMLGETRFALGVLPGADAEGLPSAWERFALPFARRTVGQGPAEPTLPRRGRLLHVRGAELSAVRRVRNGGVEVRVWNPSAVPRAASVAARDVALGPARIETLTLDRPPAPG